MHIQKPAWMKKFTFMLIIFIVLFVYANAFIHTIQNIFILGRLILMYNIYLKILYSTPFLENILKYII